MRQLLTDVFVFQDTCNVYVIRNGRRAVLIDFGTGDVLQHLAEIDVDRVSDVLITHHHRDQCQGLQLAVDHGIRIWVPHTEQDLFHSVDAHWQARAIANNYNSRQDRFSLLEPVPVHGTLEDYATYELGGLRFRVLPTPGHTPGSITLWLELHGQRLAFTGDLIAAPGKLWSLAATQWSYNGAEGIPMTIASLLDLAEREPDLLLPSHGEVMGEPQAAIDLLVSRLWKLLQLRGQYKNLYSLREQPYEQLSPHLLMNRTSIAKSYVLLSESGKALLIDYGYDFIMGLPAGTDRASRRPWLYTLPALRQQFGVTSIDVVIPTHFHDDHVAGFNLLRQAEGAQVWAADLFADILENPNHYDLPCLWYDPIRVDRRLPLETPIQWEEYTLTLYALPGHTRYAVAIAFEVDGYRVLATGDQYQGASGLELNYVYSNRFQADDYVRSAALYKRLRPDVLLTGHWEPLWVTRQYLDRITAMGAALQDLHRELLPQTPNLGTEDFLATLTPYYVEIERNEPIPFQVEVRNPFAHPAEALVQLVVPAGWHVHALEPADSDIQARRDDLLAASIPARGTRTVTFVATPPDDFSQRRARIAADITVDGYRFGQQAEALVSHIRTRAQTTRERMETQ
ncbi:MAG: MBL fold metallo-hydrolase [Chloroflexota bacterium]|nr:MAG: hypothetical protein DIU68_13095 [Chloroflexota bacterium]